MADWDARLYRQYETERTRPAADLLAQVDLIEPAVVVDIGCGPGNSTELLSRRFPAASVVGIDTSADMLASARDRLPDCRFEQADIATWTPLKAPDLIYANAALQWVPGHEALFPRLFASLAPGGVLAVQMPDNREEPSHRAMRDTASESPFSRFVGSTAATRVRILSALAYYDLLAPLAQATDVWRTTYHHPMDSAAAIVNWVRATGLRPFLDGLPEDQRNDFLARYEELIAAAYPPRADGLRLLAFPRLFIVARRPD
jgi:trans-aconitate 2-methyltransferase